MKKKMLIAAISALSVLTLAACSSNTGGEKIATMKGATISVQDFYDHVKTSDESKQAVSEMIVSKVFDDAYSDKVSDKDVDKQFNETKESMGDQFATALKSSGLTEKSYKELIKQNLAFQEGLKFHIKLTDADIKTAWDSFHPEVEVQLMTAASEDDAKALLEEVKKDGADFGKIAKENDKNTDTTYKEDGGKTKFDSLSTTISSTVQQAAYKLKDGEISDVITDSSYDSSYNVVTNYYIVKMVKNTPKGNDMEKYDKELKEIATNTYLNDSTFRNKIIGEELKKANVKIKDSTFADVLSTYIDAAESSTAESTADTKESSTKESDSSTAESSTAESTTAESSTTESSK